MGAGRLGRSFQAHHGTTGLIPYLTVGYPSLEATLEMMRRFERAGALAIELGIPFSDPIADGLDIQRSSEWALGNGVGPDQVFELIARYRRDGELPLILMTYANPVVRAGIDSFARRAHDAGADAVLLTDVPPDECPELWQALDAAALDTIVLVAPTTADERIPQLLERCRGFVYCLSRTGVTGDSAGYTGAMPERMRALRALTPLPIAVGFGISNPDQARALRGLADAIVVGAAFMREIARDPQQGVEDRVERMASELSAALQ